MSVSDPVVIAGAARTPMGGFQGELSAMSAAELGGVAVRAALEGAGVAPDQVDEIVMGNVLGAGQGQAPARQAAFAAGLPKEVPASTLNKMCGSGMKTTMIAHDQLLAGNGSVVVAGGMESMTNAPYLLPKMRGGARLGHGEVKDHMFLDGLEDAYDKGRLMGTFAEDCAEKYQFTRDEQDAYAIRSLEGALKAQAEGRFEREIAPVTISGRGGETVIASDEQPRNARPDKIPNLKPAFRKDGTVTAANSSSISDGAAVLVLMRQSEAERRGLSIRARILGHASHAQEPAWFSTAPIPAMTKLMEKIGWKMDDVDLWEINEAFAVVPMKTARDLGLDMERVNVNGGAIAMGHPLGATGCVILGTLLDELERRDLATGCATLCVGGGMGIATIIERV